MLTHLRRFLTWGILLWLAVVLAACGQGAQLPKPPAGGGLGNLPQAPAGTLPATVPPAPTLPAQPTLPGLSMPAGERPAQPTPDWRAVKTQAASIQQTAQELSPAWEQVATAVSWIQQHETDPEVLELASQMSDLIAQAEHDAAQLAVTAGDINYRIDHSEATTLRLSDDIGKMADRIGEMADRILWTEGQIGVMADRIVHSEHLINDGTQQTIDQMQETLGQIADLAREVTAHTAALRQELPPVPSEGASPAPQEGAGAEGAAPAAGTPGTENSQEGTGASGTGNTGAESGGNATSGSAVGGGSVAGTAAAPQGCASGSPRKLEVLSRSIYLNSTALQRDLTQAQALAAASNRSALAESLQQAEQAASQIALVAGGLHTSAEQADVLTPALCAQARQAVAQIQQATQALKTALQQAQAQGVDGEAPSAHELKRILDTSQVTLGYLIRWNQEIGQIVQP